ncbi:MAG TPA: DUF3455 domain-containing protein [Albitalea sp.]
MIHSNPLRSARRLLATTALAGVLAACATAPEGHVPPALDPGAQVRALTTLAASGVQIYECRADGAAAPAWTFVAPEAALVDGAGRPAGSHGAGPHWTHPDGSRIVGRLQARADAPSAADIPWLLLNTQSTGTDGVFSRVSHIQRIRTEGGVAPASGCDARTLGQRLRVPYRADYRLLVPA